MQECKLYSKDQNRGGVSIQVENSSSFPIKNLEDWEYKVDDLTARLLKVFDSYRTAPPADSNDDPNPIDLTLDFNKYINLITIEAINKISLSANLGLIEQGTDEVTAEKWNGNAHRAHYRQTQNQTARAQATFAGEKLDDFFSSLMHDKSEIVTEAGAIITASAETTAIAITNMMELLIRHPPSPSHATV
ncbi:uncharacterized protein Z518_00106 [Rhinocladiella mackenziei CBS 650.93]|uniref:Uncharacterized protein n=1 Tax=Rhinocladiella mackenziei CBS 650.93 TaxID=1442369 RepID=A0A0D2HEL6_9EURO|nr:uncharacterized protein Z518_00106 [Rhinocladiella mackenziei CBS 650.93]KIX09028.1 hypothetical protein Z518_00106 [Rhinocladiella mackenziei CBS 650.93]